MTGAGASAGAGSGSAAGAGLGAAFFFALAFFFFGLGLGLGFGAGAGSSADSTAVAESTAGATDFGAAAGSAGADSDGMAAAGRSSDGAGPPASPESGRASGLTSGATCPPPQPTSASVRSPARRRLAITAPFYTGRGTIRFMKLLMIGGTGLISSASTALAIRQGHAVTLLNRGKTGHTAPPGGAEILTADVRDRGSVEAALQGRTFDAVVNWIAFTPEHVEQDLAVFGGKTGHYVFISSASTYRKPPIHYVITESTPLENPHWEYSRHKIACEQRLIQAFMKDGFPATIVRPSLTYGDIQIPLAISCWHAPYTLITRARQGRPLLVPGDGTSLWVVTHNTDFAKGLVGLLGNERSHGEAFHITSDEALPWNELYGTFAKACGAEPVLRHVTSEFMIAVNPGMEGSLIGDKAQSTVFDNSKIRQYVPDFRCTTPFAQGIRDTVAWFDADPRRQTVDPESERFWDRIIAAHDRAAADVKAGA